MLSSVSWDSPLTVLAYIKLNFWKEFLPSMWAHSAGCASRGPCFWFLKCVFCVSSLKQDRFGYPMGKYWGCNQCLLLIRILVCGRSPTSEVLQHFLAQAEGSSGNIPGGLAQEGAVVLQGRASMQVLGAQLCWVLPGKLELNRMGNPSHISYSSARCLNSNQFPGVSSPPRGSGPVPTAQDTSHPSLFTTHWPKHIPEDSGTRELHGLALSSGWGQVSRSKGFSYSQSTLLKHGPRLELMIHTRFS